MRPLGSRLPGEGDHVEGLLPQLADQGEAGPPPAVAIGDVGPGDAGLSREDRLLAAGDEHAHFVVGIPAEEGLQHAAGLLGFGRAHEEQLRGAAHSLIDSKTRPLGPSMPCQWL